MYRHVVTQPEGVAEGPSIDSISLKGIALSSDVNRLPTDRCRMGELAAR